MTKIIQYLFPAVMSAIILALAPVATAQAQTDSNIAAGKKCSFNRKPERGSAKGNYRYILTDQKTVKAGSLMWGSTKGALRWKVRGRKPHPAITIDLGKTQPISGVTLHAGGGASGGVFPSVIYIQVSKDGKTFHTVGDLVQMEEALAPPSYYNKAKIYQHWYRTHNLRTKGRYVRFVLLPGLRWLSCDEVQVFRGNSSWLNDPIGGKILNETQLNDPLKLTQKGVRRRQRLDVSAVRLAIENAAAQKQISTAIKQILLKKLEPLEKQARQPSNWPQSIKKFQAIVPVGNLDAKILSIYGQLLKATGSPALTLWHSPPYQLLPLLQRPTAQVKHIKLRMMQNEHRAQVFNITNASAKPRSIKFNFVNLPTQANSSVHVYNVEYVDMAEGRPVASALLPLTRNGNTYTTTVPAGMTRQIWLSINSANIPANTYHAQISLQSGEWNKQLDFTLSVAPIRMANHMALNTEDWDYLAYGRYMATNKNKLSLAKLLLSHGVNIVAVHDPQMVAIPKPKVFDKRGNLIGKIDYSGWDKAVKFWRKTSRDIGVKMPRIYAVANGYFRESYGGEARSNFAGFKLGTPECNQALSQWAADWAKHNHKLGLKPKQVVLLFIDEPRNVEQWNATAILAKAFKKGTHDILIKTDFSARNMQQFKKAAKMLKSVDIIQPALGSYVRSTSKLQEVYQRYLHNGKSLWFYSCIGSTKQFGTSYYSMQPWYCYVTGATGSGFWGYADTPVVDNWNPYLPITKGGDKTDYSPLMITPTRASTTKHWEAMREGVEDYQYLTMLARSGKPKTAKRIAQSVTQSILKNHGRYYYTSWSDLYRFAHQARLQVLDMIIANKEK